MSSDYRVSQPVTVRFMGAFLVLIGALVFGVALVVGFLNLSTNLLSATVVLAVVAVVLVGAMLTRLAVLVHLDDMGYRVRYLRKAGVNQARWVDVEDVVTGFASDQAVVVLRLRDGRTTTVPVNLIQGSAEDFVKDIAAHAKLGNQRG